MVWAERGRFWEQPPTIQSNSRTMGIFLDKQKKIFNENSLRRRVKHGSVVPIPGEKFFWCSFTD